MSVSESDMMRPDSNQTPDHPGLGFDTWRTPNSDRPVFINADIGVGSTSTTPGIVDIEVDEDGGTSADYGIRLRAPTGLTQTPFETFFFIVPPGASYRYNNVNGTSGQVRNQLEWVV